MNEREIRTRAAAVDRELRESMFDVFEREEPMPLCACLAAVGHGLSKFDPQLEAGHACAAHPSDGVMCRTCMDRHLVDEPHASPIFGSAGRCGACGLQVTERSARSTDCFVADFIPAQHAEGKADLGLVDLWVEVHGAAHLCAECSALFPQENCSRFVVAPPLVQIGGRSAAASG